MPPPPYNSKGFRHFRLGFTLAETLITLTIIGIIAALTVPTLMRKYQEHQTVVAVKEAYSIAERAYKMAVAENGPSETWDIGDVGWIIENHIKVMNYFKPYLKLADYDVTKLKQVYSQGIKTLDGRVPYSGDIGDKVVKLQNGMVLIFDKGDEQTMFITVDINGTKQPNTFGIDTFLFAIKDNKLYPSGTAEYMFSSPKLLCNINERNNADNGKYCTYWIIYKGNMDYLHRDVSNEW